MFDIQKITNSFPIVNFYLKIIKMYTYMYIHISNI